MTDIKTNDSPRAALVTLGCPMNQVDSENILGGLVSLGFEIVPEESADVIIVNTCGFIEDAREESIEAILSVSALKETGNLKALVVAGCLAERYSDELKLELTETDAIVGLSERSSIPTLCLKLLNRDIPAQSNYSRAVTGPMNSAYIRVAEGCSHTCSYCAIPMIRGGFRSVPIEDVLREADELASIGTHELILIGQDTTRYGADLDGSTLPDLLTNLSKIDGIEWLRLMYAHPGHFSDTLIEAFATLPKVLPYIDIPLQHISASILKQMGRIPSPDKTRALLDKIRTEIDGVVLRTAMIVGFPGETDKDFQELIDFVEALRFERLGAFVFSPEEGTRAAEMANQVPEEVAVERYNTLMEIQSRISSEYHHTLIGKEFDMIIDTFDPDTGAAKGRSYMDAPEIDGNISLTSGVKEGSAFCRVRVTDVDTYDLIGEVVNNHAESTT